MTIIGRSLFARQKKSGREYVVSLNGQHLQVLVHLHRRGPASDWDIVKAIVRGSHQLGARRCELRDAGLVQQVGTCESGMVWDLTQAGRDLLEEHL